MPNISAVNKSRMKDYIWSTQEYHPNNMVTMSDYLNNHLDENSEIIMVDGTYAEIISDGYKYAVHASGNGDSFNHKVRFETL